MAQQSASAMLNMSDGSGSRIAVTNVAERQRQIKRAQRNTIFVKAARVVLPAAVVVIGGVYLAALLGLGSSFAVQNGRGRIEIGSLQSISRDGIGMANPRYQGFGQDGSRYHVTAVRAITDLSTKKAPLKLETIKGELVQADGGIVRLNATRGTIDTLTSVLFLSDGIHIETDRGMIAQLERATVESKVGRITSDRPVRVGMAAGEVRANSLELLQKARIVSFDNGVATRLLPRPASEGKASSTVTNTAGATGTGLASASSHQSGGSSVGPRLFSSSGAPVDITSTRLVIKDVEKSAEFLGNVMAAQGDATLAAERLLVTYSGSQLPGGKQKTPSEPISTGSTTGAGSASPSDLRGSIKLITARENVVLSRGSDRVTSPIAVFDVEKEQATLTGGVTMTSGPDRRVVSSRADLDSKAETALLTGDVVLTQGQNELRGARLKVDRKAQTLELTGTTAAGRISARLQPPSDSNKSGGKPTRSSPSSAGLGDIGFRPAAGTPISIAADRLDVSDKVHTATFRGDVAAAQGDFTLNSTELVVTYEGGGPGLGLVNGAAPAATKSSPAKLKRIQARQKVVVRTGPN